MELNNKIHIVIPARYGSTRLPGKPLLEINGTPMIVLVYKAAKSTGIGDVVVATDDDRIISVLLDEKIPYLKTSNLHKSGTDRINEVAKNKGWNSQDIVLNLQGDEPLIPPQLLYKFQSFIQKPDMQIATVSTDFDSKEDVFSSDNVKLVVSKKNEAIYFSRAPIPFPREYPRCNLELKNYRRHVGIYAYRVGILDKISHYTVPFIETTEMLEQLRALYNGISISVMHYHGKVPHGVDTLEDLERIREVIIGD